MSETPFPPPPPYLRPGVPRAPVPPSPVRPPRRRFPRGAGTVVTALLAAVVATVTTLAITGAITPQTAGTGTAKDTLAVSAAPTAAPSAAPTVAPTSLPSPAASTPSVASPSPASTPAAPAATSSLAAVIATARKSVVTVDVQGVAGIGRGGFQVQTSGSGSGVIVSADGYILTAQHVVENASSVSVTLQDGSTHDATVVATSSTADAALIKISATGLTAAPLSTGTVSVGDAVLALGNPLGQYADSVSMGIVSGTDRSIQVADMTTRSEVTRTGLIQTDAAVNEGNSGGPLMDTQGRVVGLITATATNAEGIAFATPVSEAVPLLTKAGVATAG